ncbi:hypothetical protein EFA69_04060 [Rufibacter immobilis]|uniref:Uncharacterized protein n=1 Tax=Rufibacter immobilis TaxID=1348778 RepID=A0A3M9N3X6_9BACT|nr:hypothetical protein EFA69_04060 [Rufibacter immobilis]
MRLAALFLKTGLKRQARISSPFERGRGMTKAAGELKSFYYRARATTRDCPYKNLRMIDQHAKSSPYPLQRGTKKYPAKTCFKLFLEKTGAKRKE